MLKAFYHIFGVTLLFFAVPRLPLSAQQIFDPPCTSLDLRYPSYVVSGRLPVPVSIEVLGAKEVLGPEQASRLSYQWTVSQGKLISGQGTPNILVGPGNATGVSEILFNVKLIGGHPACETERSFSIKIDADCVSPNKIDEYGDVSFSDETVHLDTAVKQLAATDLIYILAYAGRNSCLWDEAKSRALRAKKYLIDRHGIQSDRIVIGDNGYRENLIVELFVGPHGSCAPLATPTVARSAVKLKGFCREKYKNQRAEQIGPSGGSVDSLPISNFQLPI